MSEQSLSDSIFRHEYKNDKVPIFMHGFEIVLFIIVIALIISVAALSNKIKPCNSSSSTSETKEGMAPAQRFHLAQSYAKIPTEQPKKEGMKVPGNEFDTALRNPSNGRRKTREGLKLYDDPMKAGNPMSVARGGMPMNYELKKNLGKNANMEVLDNNAHLNGPQLPPTGPEFGKSDIVPYGTSSRMAGVNQNLSSLTGITSSKHSRQ